MLYYIEIGEQVIEGKSDWWIFSMPDLSERVSYFIAWDNESIDFLTEKQINTGDYVRDDPYGHTRLLG